MSQSSHAPPPTPISHHLLLCATPTKALCCPDPQLGVASWDCLKRLVRELGLEDPKRPEGIVLRSKADCLRICDAGPVLLIWPDGIVYGQASAERIETILREHIVKQRPIESWIIKRYASLGASAHSRSTVVTASQTEESTAVNSQSDRGN